MSAIESAVLPLVSVPESTEPAELVATELLSVVAVVDDVVVNAEGADDAVSASACSTPTEEEDDAVGTSLMALHPTTEATTRRDPAPRINRPWARGVRRAWGDRRGSSLVS